MEKNFSLTPKQVKLLLLWIVSLIYYNTVECFIVFDRLRHIENMHYQYMNMRVAFLTYPIMVFFAIFFYKRTTNIVYYSGLFILALAYTYIVVYLNVPYFPFKTWFILLLFWGSITMCIFINKKIEKLNIKRQINGQKQGLSFLITILISCIIAATIICHFYMI